MSESTSCYPSLSVDAMGTGIVSQAGAVMLLRTAEKTGLGGALSVALAPWRKPLATATIHEFDTVTLRHAHGRWLPGTTGAVLETFGQDAALVELVGPDGASLDMLTVPLTDLDPVQPSAAPHGPGPDRLAG